ncbi:DUF99 family protein [Halorubrum sp. DTA98]|uniref:endonuclease dU n=1 Tax=Halorubrum sp. DTA98 TaxID=3402163 RepID=UPI003AAA3CB9
MRSGSRTLGIAFSDAESTSYVAGAVVRTDGTLDGLAFDSCTIGGTDATDAILALFDGLGREDVRRVVCAGIAPAWFNVVDLHRLHAELDRPVLSVSYEASPGLEPALRREFDGEALFDRLTAYRSLPPRRRVRRDGPAEDDSAENDGSPERAPLFVRSVGIDDDRARDVVRRLTREGFRRPEPLRVASIAAGAHRRVVGG